MIEGFAALTTVALKSIGCLIAAAFVACAIYWAFLPRKMSTKGPYPTGR